VIAPPSGVRVWLATGATDMRRGMADVLRRIGDHPASHLDELLPWNWQTIDIAATA
jgi:hypothetical protein